jgi:hypothetical protein
VISDNGVDSDTAQELTAGFGHTEKQEITPPNTVYQFWRVSPLDAIIFFIGVLVTVFSSIVQQVISDNGVDSDTAQELTAGFGHTEKQDCNRHTDSSSTFLRLPWLASLSTLSAI